MSQTTQRRAEVTIDLDTSGSESKIDKLKAKAAELRKAFADATKAGDTKEVSRLTREINKTNSEIRRLQTNAERVRDAMVSLDKATPKQLRNTIKMINAELNSGRVARGSREWNDYVKQLQRAQAELKKVKAEMEGVGDDDSLLDKLKDAFNDWAAPVAAASAAFAGVVMSGRAAVKAFADMEAEEANVRKFTGMTAEEVKALNDEFKKMDTRTSREELNKLAQEAGRLGKTDGESVLGFVKAADQLNVALDDLGQGATLTLSKLTGIFGDEKIYGTEQSLLKVGSVINELSQNCSASAPYLAEFSSRLGGIAAQSNMTISQVMAFAAVLDTQNLALEASSTAVGQLITKIYQEPQQIAKAAGLDIKAFSDMVKKDMNGALIMLFEHLSKFGGMENLASVFDAMGTDGARAIPVLAALTGHIAELKEQQEVAAEAFREGISVTNEFNVQNSTVEAGLEKARKGFNEMAVTLGERLVPVMSHCISGTSMLMRVMNELINFAINNREAIVALAIAVAAYTLAIKEAAIETAFYNTVTKVAAATKTLLAPLVLRLKVAYLSLTNQTIAAARAQVALNNAQKANIYMLIVAAVVTLCGWLVSLHRRTREAAQAQEELRQKQEEYKASLRSVADSHEKSAQREIKAIKALEDAAKDENRSRKERLEAVESLKRQYPDYFGKLSTEQIMVGDTKDAYDKLVSSILAAARARAGADKIIENEDAAYDLDKQIAETEENIEKVRELNRMWNSTAPNMPGTGQRVLKFIFGITGKEDFHREITENEVKRLAEEEKKLREKVRDLQEQRQEISKANDELMERYGVSEKALEESRKASLEITTTDVPKLGETDKQRQAREKAEREAERRRKEEIKKALNDEKAIYQKSVTETTALYSTGGIDYREYLTRMAAADDEYLKGRKKVYTDRHQEESAEYASLLREEEETKRKHNESMRKLDIKTLDSNRASAVDTATSAFFDPRSEAFQNQKALDKQLLEADVTYLQSKLKLYERGSEDYLAIEAELSQRLADDRNRKQQETAEAYLQFLEKYGKSSGSIREQAETAILEDLHKKGLVSEEQYQKALAQIKKKYIREDREKEKADSFDSKKSEKWEELLDGAYTSAGEFDRIIMDLYQSFHDLFDSATYDSNSFWQRFQNAAISSLAAVSAGLQMASSYMQACQDAELAKIESRYDKEIEAAGNNRTRVAALEKKKEQEVARTKKKYNDRAMKMEIAQAIAQTATNALGAYGAMVEIPVVGPALAAAAAAMALAAGMVQVATIKKQHQAQAQGYYAGGFTSRNPDSRKEVGVVHANEFVANHQAVSNPAIAPVLHLIDQAQKSNTVGSLTAADVTNALGRNQGVSVRGGTAGTGDNSEVSEALTMIAGVTARSRQTIDRLAGLIEDGLPTFMVMDGEHGFDRQYKRYLKANKRTQV